MLTEFLREPRIAYFTMEIALRDEVPTYAGGLGVLAGDTVRAAADLDVPLVAVSLVSRAGYFRQEIDANGWQIERDDLWDPAQYAQASQAKIALHIEGREVWVRSWLYVVSGLRGHRIPVLLLDTDLDDNRAEDRQITDRLYGGDEANRLKQEMVLGIGGVRMLHALGFEIRQYHLNEGHSALLALELLRWFVRSQQEVGSGSAYDIPRVRQLCNFTTHTPVEAGHDQFSYELVQHIVGDVVDPVELKALAGEQRLNMTRLALNLSEYVNGVSTRHAEVSQHSFPGFQIHAVANGVHPGTWTCPDFARLYDKTLPAWRHEPELLSRIADQISDEDLWTAHNSAKRVLIERVNRLTGVRLRAELPVLAFARRMTSYKRPDLLFWDIERLKHIADALPFQVLIAGKAHPNDQPGKELIHRLTQHARELSGSIPVVFLPNYGTGLALELVSGADVWLNTPLRPLEGSGTSGMKAAFNGVPSLSILDGWWIEGCIEGVTGWAIGTDAMAADEGDARSLYEKLETKVLPLYRSGGHAWAPVMRGAIGKNAAYFNSHRMMRRYAIEAYIR